MHSQLGLPAPGLLARTPGSMRLAAVATATADALALVQVPTAVTAGLAAGATTVQEVVRSLLTPAMRSMGDAAGITATAIVSIGSGVAVAGVAAEGVAAGASALSDMLRSQAIRAASAAPMIDALGADRTEEVARLVEHMLTHAADGASAEADGLRTALAGSMANPRVRRALADLAAASNAQAAAEAALVLSQQPGLRPHLTRLLADMRQLQSELDRRVGLFGGAAEMPQGVYMEACLIARDMHGDGAVDQVLAPLIVAARQDAAEDGDRHLAQQRERVVDSVIHRAAALVAERTVVVVEPESRA